MWNTARHQRMLRTRQKLRASQCARCRTRIGLSSRRSASIFQGLSSCQRARRLHSFSLMIGKGKRSLTVVTDGTRFYGKRINLTQATPFPTSTTVPSCDRLGRDDVSRDSERDKDMCRFHQPGDHALSNGKPPVPSLYARSTEAMCQLKIKLSRRLLLDFCPRFPFRSAAALLWAYQSLRVPGRSRCN